MELRNCRKQPYELGTAHIFGEYECKSTKHSHGK